LIIILTKRILGMNIFIGIEGVGMRQSIAVASDKNGHILNSIRISYPLSLTSLSREDLQTNLFRLFRSICHNIGCDIGILSKATVCIGMTGITFPFDRYAELPNEIENMRLKIGNLICTGDPQIILASHAISNEGSCITCSMGSMAYVKFPNGEYQWGGWGPAIGDEGSGFSMGRQALRAIGESYDSGQPESESVLWQKVKKWLERQDEYLHEWDYASIIWRKYSEDYKDKGCDLRTAIADYAENLSRKNHFLWRSLASGIVIPLMEAVDDDQIAKAIVDEAAESLCDQLTKTCVVAKVDINHGPLVLYGGVFRHHPEFLDLVICKLRKKGLSSATRIITPLNPSTMRPVMGALLYALGNSTNDVLKLPDKAVIDELLSEQNCEQNREILQND
jgi:N-acetylglucosamine kinase-like BadF-type ATPase